MLAADVRRWLRDDDDGDARREGPDDPRGVGGFAGSAVFAAAHLLALAQEAAGNPLPNSLRVSLSAPLLQAARQSDSG